MHHLNTGDGHSGTDSYQTWDHLRCPKCRAVAIEHYATCFVENIEVVPVFGTRTR